ncbi:TPA: hypothetical protein N2P42_004178 [Klebsiella pneumoniae]|nr:hypothetical protein [Klebsiella pneumoniae]
MNETHNRRACLHLPPSGGGGVSWDKIKPLTILSWQSFTVGGIARQFIGVIWPLYFLRTLSGIIFIPMKKSAFDQIFILFTVLLTSSPSLIQRGLDDYCADVTSI